MVRVHALAVLAATVSVFAAPSPHRRQQISSELLALHAFSAVSPRYIVDQVLNFALTLENLENAFYQQGLGMFDAQAFADAGFAPFVRGRLAQIGEHEAVHVKFLQGALGDQAVKECTYKL